MSGKLTTHILDTASGCPAEGVCIELYRDGSLLVSAVTNSDGRCDSPLLTGKNMFSGEAELRFHVGDYFLKNGATDCFLNVVPVVFQIQADENYHVPLVCSPYSYSTYRGS